MLLKSLRNHKKKYIFYEKQNILFCFCIILNVNLKTKNSCLEKQKIVKQMIFYSGRGGVERKNY